LIKTVLNELSKQVQAKGLTSAQNPDLIINVKASHKKVQDVTTSMNYGWGWGRPWGWGGGFGMGIPGPTTTTAEPL
jgi:hypothetical protein